MKNELQTRLAQRNSLTAHSHSGESERERGTQNPEEKDEDTIKVIASIKTNNFTV